MRRLLAEKVRLWMGKVPAVNTQAKLAVKAGMSPSSVHRILHEDTEPELETAHKLACAFGVSLSEFLSDKNGEATTLLDADRYAALPDSEKAKIRAFAEFVLNSHTTSAKRQDSAAAVQENVAPSPGQAQLVEHVAQRNLTSESLRIHVDQPKKPSRKRQPKGR